MKWISSNGGPLVVIEAERASFWLGINGPSESITHYQRACEINGYVGVLSVEGVDALILNDEPLQSAWLSSDESSGIIVRWSYAETEEAVIDSLKGVHRAHFESAGLQFRIYGNLKMFDAGMPGDEPHESLDLKLVSGKYDVELCNFEPDSGTQLILIRLRRIGEFD